MQSQFISMIIGVLCVIAVGTLVYTTKKPVEIPPETGISQEVSSTNTTSQPVESTNKKTTQVKRVVSGDDDDDDDTAPVSQPTTSVSSTPSPASQTTTQNTITLARVAQHGSRTSCWSAINGNVYDLTSWIPNHPGGEQAILSICGIDGSSAYDGQHGGSSRPASILAGFKIGILSK
jgi:cytochrome b involved in lipid metabolism